MKVHASGDLARIQRLQTLLAECRDPATKKRIRARLARERNARSDRLDDEQDSEGVRRA